MERLANRVLRPARHPLPNVDERTVTAFGREWAAFDQMSLDPEELRRMFDAYFGIFPFADLPPDAEGFDLGCGSGRWAKLVADRVPRLHCVDPSLEALAVATRQLAGLPGIDFHCASANDIPLDDGSQDFGYSLGVLHHVPDTAQALSSCVRKLKPGAPFLLYLYYRFDNRSSWFRRLWKMVDVSRRAISRTPFVVRRSLTNLIALVIYWPMARTAKIGETLGMDVGAFPLSSYRNSSFYTMRTDALDRFGTRLEKRFTRAEIVELMEDCGLTDIRFSDAPPYWVACGRKTRDSN